MQIVHRKGCGRKFSLSIFEQKGPLWQSQADWIINHYSHNRCSETKTAVSIDSLLGERLFLHLHDLLLQWTSTPDCSKTSIACAAASRDSCHFLKFLSCTQRLQHATFGKGPEHLQSHCRQPCRSFGPENKLNGTPPATTISCTRHSW